MSTTTAALYYDILTFIVVLLDVKSLYAFGQVSRLWASVALHHHELMATVKESAASQGIFRPLLNPIPLTALQNLISRSRWTWDVLINDRSPNPNASPLLGLCHSSEVGILPTADQFMLPGGTFLVTVRKGIVGDMQALFFRCWPLVSSQSNRNGNPVAGMNLLCRYMRSEAVVMQYDAERRRFVFIIHTFEGSNDTYKIISLTWLNDDTESVKFVQESEFTVCGYLGEYVAMNNSNGINHIVDGDIVCIYNGTIITFWNWRQNTSASINIQPLQHSSIQLWIQQHYVCVQPLRGSGYQYCRIPELSSDNVLHDVSTVGFQEVPMSDVPIIQMQSRCHSSHRVVSFSTFPNGSRKVIEGVLNAGAGPQLRLSQAPLHYGGQFLFHQTAFGWMLIEKRLHSYANSLGVLEHFIRLYVSSNSAPEPLLRLWPTKLQGPRWAGSRVAGICTITGRVLIHERAEGAASPYFILTWDPTSTEQ